MENKENVEMSIPILNLPRFEEDLKSSPTEKILNHGFVTLINFPKNSDLMVVNSARVSFGKWKDTLDESDEKLIDYLVKNKHDSPLRHVQITFHIKAPEFVMRQWYKHIVGIAYTPAREPDHAWNEISGRYVTYEEEFYFPEIFRKQSKSNKQATVNENIEDFEKADILYKESISKSYATYKELINLGVGKEIARTVLPLTFYTEVIWTASLQAILNFISLRDHQHAQYEIQLYAKAIRKLVADVAPLTTNAWDKYRI